MKVLKFGGTSVGSADRIKEVAKLIVDGDRKLVVLSAMSGTTNSLVEISDLLKRKQDDAATEKINALNEKYIDVVDELLNAETLKKEASSLIDNIFNHIADFVGSDFDQNSENDVLAQGELISTNLMCLHLSEISVKNAWLPALDFMRTNENSEPDMRFIKPEARALINQYPEAEIFITQGFICRNNASEIDNLQRGGSDYTATILGAALDADEIQIWTDIDGMHNNDPRIVENTQPIANLSYNEAAELAYFGAKILHPTCILPAKDAEIPVRLLNTMDPDAPGTTISKEVKKGRVAAIAAKDNITAIKVKSGRMLLAHGFLRKLFEIFEENKTSIDMITTSEVGVSLTIDNDNALDDIIPALEQLGYVNVDIDQVIICIAGDFTPKNLNFAHQVTEALLDIPVRMISYGGSNYNISVLVDKEYKEQALVRLSNVFF